MCSPGLSATLSVSSRIGFFNRAQWELKQKGHGATVAHFDTGHVRTQWHPLHTLPQSICLFYLSVSHSFLKTESLIIWTKKNVFQTLFPLSPFMALAPWHFWSYTFVVHKKIVPLFTQQELWRNPWQCAICRHFSAFFLFVIRRCWNRNLIFTKQFLTVWMSLYSERCKVTDKDKD